MRDLALGEKAFDFDLATTATPDEVIRRGRRAGFKVALTGVAHGTVTLIVNGRPIEVTTLREDVETDGRHAKVAFGRDFSADARRRDFTINALSLDPDGRVHDSLGGLDDLAPGRVRFIGDADARIREDYLRILRFFRFSARFGNGADRSRGTRRSDSRARRHGPAVARARARRMPQAPRRPSCGRRSCARWATADSSSRCSAEWAIPAGSRVSSQSKRLAAREPDALLRLAALAVVISEDADRLHERLRLANAEWRRPAPRRPRR